jgi:cytochrome c oxidase cbb3-type subunit 3
MLVSMRFVVLLAAALLIRPGFAAAQANTKALIETGQGLFQEKCAFCHGRDAEGGETGPDLTGSDLVKHDVNGDKIAPVVHNGRPDKGMPKFAVSDQDIAALVAFIHNQLKIAQSQHGGRRGVEVSDLQTGNVEKGKQYFSGAGGCSSCHSPTGDLAGVASRYQGLKLEMRLLYPENSASKVTVTLPNGETASGRLAYRDEFTIALRDSAGAWRSWPADSVKYKVDAPVEAHADLLGKYTDDDIHNLMAYLQTLR